MNKFNVISQKFYNQYRNGDTFTLNLGEFATRLQGNVGEKVKLVEVIELATIVNEEEAILQEFRQSDSALRAIFLDYEQEGLYNGASVRIEFDGETINGTVEGITNNGSDLLLDAATITALAATSLAQCATRTDITIKVTNDSTYLLYKYGVNPNSRTATNYLSPLDGAEQSYQLQGITGVLQQMRFTGKEIGSDLGVVKVKFDATRESYKHQYTIEHEFLIPYYTEGQLSNIANQTNPLELQRNSSLKYGNGFFFGGDTNNTVAKFEDTGRIGNVGYFGDNFNGFEGFYDTENIVITNSLGTGKLEATVINTVTFSITSNSPIGFSGGEEIILYHSKLPTSQEYGNSKIAFDTTWITSQVRQTEGAGAVGSGVFSNVTVALSAGKLDVSADVTYTTTEQALLDNVTLASLYFTIATQDLADPDNMDRSNVKISANKSSKDEQVSGLILNWQPGIYKHSDFDTGVTYTDFNGWDGDLNGQSFTFDTDVDLGAFITGVQFLIVADNGTDYFELYSQIIPINLVQFTEIGGNNFQVLNIDIDGGFNLPTDELINRVKLNAVVPGAPSSTQSWSGSIGFQVPWREWVANSDVPLLFYDNGKPQNNQNTKSSNYSGVSGYTIKTLVKLQVQSPGDQVTLTTVYEGFSDSSSISDFDTDGGTFTGDVKLYDSNNDLVDNIFTNDDVRVEIEFPHSLGTLLVGNLEGMIWIEKDQGTVDPNFLSTHLDFTSTSNPLVPTDTLMTGNVTLVEVVSILNKVTLICEIDRTKLVEGQDYKIYGRLDSI